MRRSNVPLIEAIRAGWIAHENGTREQVRGTEVLFPGTGRNFSDFPVRAESGRHLKRSVLVRANRAAMPQAQRPGPASRLQGPAGLAADADGAEAQNHVAAGNLAPEALHRSEAGEKQHF